MPRGRRPEGRAGPQRHRTRPTHRPPIHGGPHNLTRRTPSSTSAITYIPPIPQPKSPSISAAVMAGRGTPSVANLGAARFPHKS